MKLKKWLTENKIGMNEFAKRIGLTRYTIWRYCNGSRQPSLDAALKIEKATNGEVTCGDWKCS